MREEKNKTNHHPHHLFRISCPHLVSGPFPWRIPGAEGEPGAAASTTSGPTGGHTATAVPAATGGAAAATVAERAQGGGREKAKGDQL